MKILINVIGLGYIGLPTALALAAAGHQVVGTDIQDTLVDTLRSGNVTFKEEGLVDTLNSAIGNGIRFQTSYVPADVYIISVPTPYEKKTKRIDASYVKEAMNSVLAICPDGAIIVIESTVSPGTIDRFIRPLLIQNKSNNGKNVHLVHAPERILPGRMFYELKHNARTIGADQRCVGEKIREIYASFCEGEITITDIRTAEMTKVVENTYRDINIAFANELLKICRSDNMNVYEIIRIANKHPRVNILQPGPGIGGHCISVDPWFLVGDYPGLANIILAARKINDSMPEFVLERVYEVMIEHAITDISRIGFYGLTYKENVDDTRESPTLQALESMSKHLAYGSVKVYDPLLKNALVPNQYDNLEAFLDAVDLVVIFVAHDEIKQNMRSLEKKVVLDTRGYLEESSNWHHL